MHKSIAVIALVLGATSIARAQDPNREPMCVIDGNPHPASDCGPGGPRPPGDPLARYLFPPELVMANQQAINLTDRQRQSLSELRFHSRFSHDLPSASRISIDA